MRSQEWVKKFEELLEKRENALMRYMEIPAHQSLIRDRLLLAELRALEANFAALQERVDAFAVSDGEVTDDRP